MKYIIKSLSYSLFHCSIVFFSIAFYNATFDITNWTTGSRAFVAASFISIVIAVFLWCTDENTKENNND